MVVFNRDHLAFIRNGILTGNGPGAPTKIRMAPLPFLMLLNSIRKNQKVIEAFAIFNKHDHFQNEYRRRDASHLYDYIFPQKRSSVKTRFMRGKSKPTAR